MTQPLLTPDDFAFADEPAIWEAIRVSYAELYRRAAQGATETGVLYNGKPWPDLSRHRLDAIRVGFDKVRSALLCAAVEVVPPTAYPEADGEPLVMVPGAVPETSNTPPTVTPDTSLATEAQRGAILSMARRLWGDKAESAIQIYITVPLSQITKQEASELLDKLRLLLIQQAMPGLAPPPPDEPPPSDTAPVAKSLFISLINAAKGKGLDVDDKSREARLEATNEVLTAHKLPMVTSWKELAVEQYNVLYMALQHDEVTWSAAELEVSLPVDTTENELESGRVSESEVQAGVPA